MKVESKVHVYEIDGKDTKVGDKADLNVRNVWNRNMLVELQFNEKEKIVVHVEDLRKALDNATGNERI